MAFIVADRVMESSTTTGTGAFTLAAAYTGYRRFSAAMSTSDTCKYVIEAVDANGNPSGDWEVGIGTYSSANTLTRTTVETSSNANAAVNFAAGTKRVMLDASAALLNSFLIKTNNLSDVSTPATARSNLSAAASGDTTASGLTMNTAKLLGRTTASSGAIEEISVGSGLLLSSGSLVQANSAIFEEQRAANVAGGASVSGSWLARALNTSVYNDITGVTAFPTSTVTMTIASPCVVTWTAHGLPAGSSVTFTTSGALPTGLTAGTIYYVLSPAANTFNVAATKGGAAINTSGSQSGTHTATSNAISLPSGTYDPDASSHFFSSNLCRIRLFDLTNNATLKFSDNMYGSAVNAGSSSPRILGKFTLAGAALIQLEYRATTAMATNGLGVVSNWGEIEIYSRLKLTKIA